MYLPTFIYSAHGEFSKKFRITSRNINRLTDFKKLADLFKGSDVICLQELTDSGAMRINRFSDFKLYSIPKGEAGIVVKKKWEPFVSHPMVLANILGTYNIADLVLNIDGVKIRFICFYGPSDQQDNIIKLLNNLNGILGRSEANHDEIIMLGDFNHVMDANYDALRIPIVEHENYLKEEMKSFENAFNLVDVMRSIDNWIYAPTNRYYTNLRRIDRVYITSNMRSKVIGYGQTNKTQIGTHAQLHLEISLNIDSQPELIPHDINSKQYGEFENLKMEIENAYQKMLKQKIGFKVEYVNGKRQEIMNLLTDQQPVGATPVKKQSQTLITEFFKPNKTKSNAMIKIIDIENVKIETSNDDSYSQNEEYTILDDDKMLLINKLLTATYDAENFSYNSNSWDCEEETMVIQLYEILGPKWSLMSSLMMTRSFNQIRMKYTEVLNHKIIKDPFNSEELKTIEKLYGDGNKRWCDIAGEFNKIYYPEGDKIRTGGQISRAHKRDILGKKRTQVVPAHCNTGPWTYEEKETFKKLYVETNGDFDKIASALNRSVDQIKKKWNLDLNPELDKSSIEGEELEFIQNSHLTKCNEWIKLQKAVQKKFKRLRSRELLRNRFDTNKHRQEIRVSWTQKEIDLLRELTLGKNSHDWKEISNHFESRKTAAQCLSTYLNEVAPKVTITKEDCEAYSNLRKKGYNTAESSIFSGISSRKIVSAKQTFKKKEIREAKYSNRQWTKGDWNDHDTQLLLRLVKQFGEDYDKISSVIGNRSPASCRDRYCHTVRSTYKECRSDRSNVPVK
ncbi:hypothetical protein MEQ_03225 [Candida albicans P87]|nr:hypothetical protein MG1_05235 [Candida albicans GC75]KGU08577.1 hypothetical protein MEQ_03225 [Candida albicans P87]KGU24035.1 hypothetical protein MGM_05164 [Candida albicans P75063]KHC31440.1 hypothetical protein W5O_05246 [Candida albicans Ca6]